MRAAPTALLSWIVAWRPAAARSGPYVPRLSTAELGALGEELAARFLRRLGFVLIGRNLDAQEAELDIVAVDGDHLVVIEVKTGWCPSDPILGEPTDPRRRYRRPKERISATGIRRRLRAARRLASDVGARHGRVDAIEVIAGRGPRAEVLHHPRITPDARP